MSTAQTEAAAAEPAENIEQRFNRLKADWKAATVYHSNPSIIMRHPAMRAIVAMGDDVVPIILRELSLVPSMGLIWALGEITGENIAPPKVENGFVQWSLAEQVQAWQQWGHEKGLV